MPFDDAVHLAVDACIRDGVLAEFLRRNKAEVTKMSIYEFDEEEYKLANYEVGFEEGLEQGLERGIEQGIEQGIEHQRAKDEAELAKYRAEVEHLRAELASLRA